MTVDIDVIDLKHGHDETTSCKINLFGCTVTSWTVNGQENLFVSSKAALDGSRAIRGGIPICFPVFGAWKFGPNHGFARTSKNWRLVQAPSLDDKTGDASATFTLEETEETKAMWHGEFMIMYTVTLRAKDLKLDVDIVNRGHHNLELTFALHTYFRVPDVRRCEISGLQGVTISDKALNFKEYVEERPKITVNDFIDRVYKNAPDSCTLSGLEGGRKIKLYKENFADFEVWNPWSENTAKFSDMEDNEYLNMICVEAVQTSTPLDLNPGEHWKSTHILSVL